MNITDLEQKLKSIKDTYETSNAKIELVANTDHNGVYGYFEISGVHFDPSRRIVLLSSNGLDNDINSLLDESHNSRRL